MNRAEIITEIEALYNENRDIHGRVVSKRNYRLTPERLHNANSKVALMEREINWLKGQPPANWRNNRLERMESELGLWKQLIAS